MRQVHLTSVLCHSKNGNILHLTNGVPPMWRRGLIVGLIGMVFLPWRRGLIVGLIGMVFLPCGGVG